MGGGGGKKWRELLLGSQRGRECVAGKDREGACSRGKIGRELVVGGR